MVQNIQFKLEADNPVLQVLFSQLILDLVAWSQNTTSFSFLTSLWWFWGYLPHLEFSKGGVQDGVSNKIHIL